MIWRLIHLFFVIAGGVQLYAWLCAGVRWAWQRLNEHVFEERP